MSEQAEGDHSECGICGEPIEHEYVEIGLTLMNLCGDCYQVLQERMAKKRPPPPPGGGGLREAFDKYSDHLGTCRTNHPEHHPLCDCGYDETVAALGRPAESRCACCDKPAREGKYTCDEHDNQENAAWDAQHARPAETSMRDEEGGWHDTTPPHAEGRGDKP